MSTGDAGTGDAGTGQTTSVSAPARPAFGGLATAAEPPLPELEAGDTHTSEQFALTPLRAYFSDEKIQDLTLKIEENQDVIAVVMEVTNVWSAPIDSPSFQPNFRLADLLDQEATVVALLSDTTPSPWFQPGVVTTVVVAWIVEEGMYAPDDELTLLVGDRTRLTDEFLNKGEQVWSPPTKAAQFTLPLRLLEPEPEPEA